MVLRYMGSILLLTRTVCIMEDNKANGICNWKYNEEIIMFHILFECGVHQVVFVVQNTVG